MVGPYGRKVLVSVRRGGRFPSECEVVVHPDSLKKLLLAVQHKKITVEKALQELRTLPFQDLGFAKVDTHRTLRRGFPEVIYCEDKEVSEITRIFSTLAKSGGNIIATHAEPKIFRAIRKEFPKVTYYKRARLITLVQKDIKKKGLVVVVSGGTSDIPVAEEARVTAELIGADTKCIYDAGVAGIHRLLAYTEWLYRARVIVVVAGMEGALPSIVGGLVDKPVIAVPTSVGYGTNFGGVAPLLAMLNSCSTGVVVVNIDNGFGAGYAAGLINRL